ncbi:hypothetical protein [Timonella sp. A28]|uniref:VG15 protein n=1 Tax=Timonella sp. A28 TaxID=3442640 RepID=UPI003EBBF918
MAVSVEDVHKALGGLHGLVEGVLDSFWHTLDLSNPAAARDALLEFVPLLVDEYGLKAASIAADWYDELRMDERIPGVYVSELAEPLKAEFVAERVRFGAQHLWEDPEQTLLFLKGASTGYISQAFNDTLALNAQADPVARGWVRKPNPGACKFCLMLAARSAENVHGGIYSSKESALLVQGRGIERQSRTDILGRTQLRGGGVKNRGSQDVGDKYHDHCRCVAVPIWPNTDIAAQHGFDPEELLRRYQRGEFDA